MLLKYDENNNELIQIEKTTFSQEGLTEPQNIEEWIRKNPNILSERLEDNLEIIGKQKQSETNKRLDLLGVDYLGNIVIIELKRDLAEEMTEFQAITYASSFVKSTFNDIIKIYAEYLKKNDVELSEETDYLEYAENNLRNHLIDNIDILEDFNINHRIILVAGKFSNNLRSAVTWLILNDIKIECIELSLFKDNNVLFIQPKKILPTPDLLENIVKIKIAEEKIEKKRDENFGWNDIEKHYEYLIDPLDKCLKQIVDELKIEPDRITKNGFHFTKGSKKIIVTAQRTKFEFRFPKSKHYEIEEIINKLGIKTFKLKDKAAIESHDMANPTPSIDFKSHDENNLQDLIRICSEWLK